MLRFKKKPGSQPTKDTLSDSQIDDLSSGEKCSGQLHGEGVLVHEPRDISRLVHYGCYGKGIFSRSAPTHHCLPQLSQIVKSSKRKRQTTGATADPEQPSPSKARDERSEVHVVEKMKIFEEAEKKRIALHSHWKKERESLTQLCDEGTRLSQTTEQEEVSDYDVAVGSGMEGDSHKSVDPKSMESDSYDSFIQRIEELRKSDPFPTREPLQLSSEEATYLAVELNALQVLSADASPVTTPALWSHFVSTSCHFVERYAAYSYYRSKGWVPKSGLKFGVDFLLYKEGPSSYHSTYAVIVLFIDDATETSQASIFNPPRCGLTWREVIAVDRVNEAAGKELIVCFVVKPQSLLHEEVIKSPSCVARLQIKEVFVKRWVPEKERES